MDSDQTPSIGMAQAMGRMEGMMTGITQTLAQQNITAADLKKEIHDNKTEVMAYLKTNLDKQDIHAAADNIVHNTVNQLAEWQKDTEPKVAQLWQDRAGQKGFIAAIMGIGTILGGAIVTAVEYFKRG